MQLHATTVAIEGRGLVILGPSGAGKSTLALELMATGAVLVADDRTDLARQGDALIASVPQALAGRIEARGIGILGAREYGPVPVAMGLRPWGRGVGTTATTGFGRMAGGDGFACIGAVAATSSRCIAAVDVGGQGSLMPPPRGFP